METKFAPAFRVEIEAILKEFKETSSVRYIREIINALPYVGAILNEHRQIVFANKTLLSILGIETFEYVLGKRPGEALMCKNANREIGGCGTSKNCKTCGAVNAILKSQELKKTQTYECEISAEQNNELRHFSFQVTASPFDIKGKYYTLFSMVDISNEKRKRLFERLFFHDILNKIGSLKGFIELIKYMNETDNLTEYIEIIEYIGNDLIEEILLQRDIISAENGDLVVRPEKVHSKDLIEIIFKQIEKHETAKEKKIALPDEIADVIFISDPVILKRILFNMLKNALEAISSNETVSIGFDVKEDIVCFTIHNNTYIPENVQTKIFYRSFSTKGKDRGLGTYSMKLLGEKYLKGKVYFKSEKEKGTTFFLELPHEYKK